MSSLSGSRSRSSPRSTTKSETRSVTSESSLNESLHLSFDPNNIGYAVEKEISDKDNVTGETWDCISVSELTSSDTVSAIQQNAHWKESDFCNDFMDPQIDHDRVLSVGGKDLHVISQILMETSDFFKILFGENFKESGQEKIELKDVETEDFIEFLNHLYSNNRKITKENFLSLYTLADKYLTPLIFKKCNDFIKENTEMINDFGQRAFDLLQMAIDMDLKEIKNVLRQHLFTKSSVLLCKKCKQVPNLMKKKGVAFKSANMKKNGILEGALYLPNDHICMEHRDYILDQNPKIIEFILESLVNSVHEVHSHSYDYTPRTESSGRSSYNSDGESAKSIVDTEKLLSNKKLLIYNFANKGPYHDSTIVVKDLVKDTEQIFNVDSKKLFYKRVIEPFGKMTATLEPCQAKESIKKHQFKPDGVKNSLKNAIFYDDAIRKMSPEAQRFILSCILKNVNKCL